MDFFASRLTVPITLLLQESRSQTSLSAFPNFGNLNLQFRFKVCKPSSLIRTMQKHQDTLIYVWNTKEIIRLQYNSPFSFPQVCFGHVTCKNCLCWMWGTLLKVWPWTQQLCLVGKRKTDKRAAQAFVETFSPEHVIFLDMRTKRKRKLNLNHHFTQLSFPAKIMIS